MFWAKQRRKNRASEGNVKRKNGANWWHKRAEEMPGAEKRSAGQGKAKRIDVGKWGLGCRELGTGELASQHHTP